MGLLTLLSSVTKPFTLAPTNPGPLPCAPGSQVLGTVKNALLIVVMMLLFGEHVTSLQGAGYFISVLAFGNYTRLKVAQIAAAPQ
jgi:hypothetical protein